MKKLFEFLRKANSEDNGNPSSSRTNTFISLLIFLAGYIGMTICICWWHSEMIPMVFEATMLSIGGVIGLRIIAKTKEQKVTASELTDIKKVDATIEADKVEAEKVQP